MAYPKDLVNISGVMEVFIKGISSKASEVDMVCGMPTIISSTVKAIKVIMKWIRNQVMGFINGKMDGFIKEILRMTTEMDSDNFLMKKTVCIRDIGLMVSKLRTNSHNYRKLLG